MTFPGIPSLRLYGFPVSHNAHASPSISSSSAVLTPSLTTSTSGSSYTTEQSFTDPTAPMPPPGPTHYEVRRAQWLTPPGNMPRAPPPPSTSRNKLETLLDREGTVDNEVIWNSGLRSVWKGLMAGGRLRRRLPLAMVIKILKAGWLHDGTWPADSVIDPPSPVPPNENAIGDK